MQTINEMLEGVFRGKKDSQGNCLKEHFIMKCLPACAPDNIAKEAVKFLYCCTLKSADFKAVEEVIEFFEYQEPDDLANFVRLYTAGNFAEFAKWFLNFMHENYERR